MAEEGKKEELDLKGQVKVLRTGIKDERRKNGQLQEEIVGLSTRAKRLEDELKHKVIVHCKCRVERRKCQAAIGARGRPRKRGRQESA